MDLIDGMKAFSQVVTTGSFTKAGERLGVSKKLISKYVKQLEDRLGVRLLNRTTRSLSLTEAGQQYYEGCRQLLDDLDELEQSIQSKVSAPKGRLYISAPVTYGEMHIIPLISQFRENYPDITIELQLSDRIVNLVDEGFDVAIRIGTLGDSSLIAKKLGPTSIILCASPDYLKSAGTPLYPDDLLSHNIIVDSNFRSGTSWPFIIDGATVNTVVTPHIQVNSARSACDLALQGKGITMCPHYVAKPAIMSGNLVQILTNYPTLTTDIYAVYSSNRNLPPKVRVFVDFLYQALSNSANHS